MTFLLGHTTNQQHEFIPQEKVTIDHKQEGYCLQPHETNGVHMYICLSINVNLHVFTFTP